MKKPWLIAFLNFLTFGVGTMLVGRRVGVGLLLTVGGALLRYEELRIAPLFIGALDPHWIVMFVGMTVVGLGTAVDGYREASEQ